MIPKTKRVCFVISVLVGFSTSGFTQQASEQATGCEYSIAFNDSGEKSSFLEAQRESGSSAKVTKLELFLKLYPNSAGTEKVLEILLETYEQLGNVEQIRATVNRLLQKDPDNLLGLWASAKLFEFNEKGESSGYQENWELAMRGLRALQKAAKPQCVSASTFAKQNVKMAEAFNGVAGTVALKKRDFPNAQRYLHAAVQSDPNHLGYVYELALSYLLVQPGEPDQGLFFLARAASLSPADARTRLDVYGKQQSLKYYDSDRIWPLIKTLAEKQPLPPPGFRIKDLR
jgi:tetratricopeptide (TPR) repeat protein